jgi:citrate lyase gamma subunit
MPRLAIALVLAWLVSPSCFAQSARADLSLIIAMDCSWSVNGSEYALQAGGIAAAFSDPEIVSAIADGYHGQISVLVIHWSTSGTQKIAIPWTVVATPADAIRLANRAARMRRQTVNGGTSISGALQFGQNAFKSAPMRADRLVIDVIADGENNDGNRVETVRDQLVRLGTTINALAVVNEVGYLHYYLRNRVIGGPGAFVERAADYFDFKRAFRKKLLREIKGELVTQKRELSRPIPG